MQDPAQYSSRHFGYGQKASRDVVFDPIYQTANLNQAGTSAGTIVALNEFRNGLEPHVPEDVWFGRTQLGADGEAGQRLHSDRLRRGLNDVARHPRRDRVRRR